MSRRAVARRLGLSKTHVALLLDGDPTTAPVKETDARGRPRVWYRAAAVETFASSWRRQRAPKRPREGSDAGARRRAGKAARYLAKRPFADVRELVGACDLDPEEAARFIRWFTGSPDELLRRADAEREERRADAHYAAVHRTFAKPKPRMKP